MRIIKLSPEDEDMRTKNDVNKFFTDTLRNQNPRGKFLVTDRRISETGVKPGELLVFSYRGDLVYIARSASERRVNEENNSQRYPHYFLVDVSTIEPVSGKLIDLEHALSHAKLLEGNLVQSQGWPKLSESGERKGQLENVLAAFRDRFVDVTSESPPVPEAVDLTGPPPERVPTQVYRILRDTVVARRVKRLHTYRCQICECTIQLPDGSYYAEAHHIQPLGQPHNGPDVEGNIICVCPNHHAELDYGVFAITLSALRSVSGHTVDARFVGYHNRHIGPQT